MKSENFGAETMAK